MAATLDFPISRLNSEQLEDILRIFANIYHVELTERSLELFGAQVLTQIQRSRRADYRPYMGAKISIEALGDKTRVWCFSTYEPERNQEEFDEKIRDYFSQIT